MSEAPPTPNPPVPEDPTPPTALGRFFRPLGEMSEQDERIALIVKALLVAALLAWGKWFIHGAGWELIESLTLITAIVGGVIFTLAILLNATLTDYKESERIIGELVSAVRRLHWDYAIIRQDKPLLTDADQTLVLFVRHLLEDLKKGLSIKLSRLHGDLQGLDRILQKLAEGGRTPVLRTPQVTMGNIVRIVDRLEVIVETSFTRAGYTFAGVVTAGTLGLLSLTRVEPFAQGLILVGFVSFLLVGLFLLIWDLDNPFSGHARINTYQLRKLERYLSENVGRAYYPPAV